MHRSLPLIRRGALAAGGATALYFAANSVLHLDSSANTDDKKKYSRPGPLWSPPKRKEMLARLRASGKGVKVSKFDDKEDDIFDLLIVGGGATGAGSALDAASRGLKVAMVERDDFSSGELCFPLLP